MGKKDHLAETSKSADTDLLNDNLSRDSPAGLVFLSDIRVIKHCHTEVLKVSEDESILQKQTGASIHFNLLVKEISSGNLPLYCFASR